MTDTFTNDPAAAAPTEKPVNYFDRYNAEADAGEPGLLERARLNAKHAYYRGTLAGASDLMGMAHVYQMDDSNATPEQKDYRKTVRDKYDNIIGDLGRYDLIKPWGTTTEGAAALAGQLAGGAASPESMVGWGSQGANLAIRTAKAAVQQGFITGTVDPIVQYLNIGGGVQKEYDPTQTATSFGVGAILGGGLHIGGELISAAHIKKTTAELGKDDPQFKAAGDVVTPEPTTVTVPQSSDQGVPVPEETVRFFHGGTDPTSGGPRWLTPDENYARNFRTAGPNDQNEVHFVDIPKSQVGDGFDEINGIYRNFEAPEEIAKQLRPVASITETAPTAPPPTPSPLPEPAPQPELSRRPANVPNDIPDELFRGFGREDKGAAYNQGGGGNDTPILGDAKYYAFDKAEAEGFGPNVEQGHLADVADNPLVIRDGNEWRKLTQAAGWQTPNPFGRPKEQLQADVARLQENIKAQGHDGVVVWWNDKTPYDIGPKGENLKLLRDVFGSPQAVSFKQSMPVKEAAAIPPTPRTQEQQALIAKRADTESNIASEQRPTETVKTAEAATEANYTKDEHGTIRYSSDSGDGALIIREVPASAAQSTGHFISNFTEDAAGKFVAVRVQDGLQQTLLPSGGWVSKPEKPRLFNTAEEAEAAAKKSLGLKDRAELALAKRTAGGGSLPMERQRPSAGISQGAGNLTGTAVSTIPTSPAQDVAIKSLQQQSVALANALDIPLRQGRIKIKNALGVFNTGSGVVRVREVPDFEVVAHEAGHAIEAKVGTDLTDLTNKFGAELAPMVSNPAAYDPAVHVKEGFAEFIRRYIGNPAHAEQVAPGFTIAFRDFMGKRAPDMLKAIDEASAGYRAYLEAPSADAVAAVVRSRSEEAHGWKKVLQDIKTDGFAATVKTVVQSVYRGLLDDKAPVALAVRDLASAIKEQSGNLVDLKAADNPEVLIRLFARSHQSAVRDMMDGVRGYHSIEPQGPSLSDALAHATGSPTVWGKWDPEKKALFSDFMVARRAILLWDKFKAGDLANPPVAFSRADAAVYMAELEKANPRFREASNMVHNWTRELLRKQYEGGLIAKDLFDKLSKEEFYVPFMRDLSDKPVAGGGGTSGSAEGPGMTDTIKRMKGSSRDIKDPIESLMTQAFLVNRTLAHNDIIKSFVKLSEQAGIEGGKFVEKIRAQEARGYNFDMAQSIERLAKERGINADDAKVLTSALTDVFGPDPIVGSFFRMEPAGKRGEPIVFYKEAGQLKAARFMSGEEGHALYETLTALPAPLTDAWSQLIAATTSTLRAGITTNPMFALTNYIRDQFAVAILRKDYIPIISGIKGIRGEFAQSEHAVLYGYGGGVSGGASIAPLEKAIENDVNALAKKGYLVNRLTSFKGLLDLAAFTEAGTRNSVFGKVFAAKKAQGLNDYEAMIEAAFSAQDILDFSRHGSHTLMIRKYIPFINAWAQGLDKAKRTMFDPIVQRVRDDQVFASDPANFNNAMVSVTKLLGVGGVLGAGWAALNAEKEGYRDASPALKGTHVVIPLGNKILLVPKPFELGIGFTAGEYGYQALAQHDPRAANQFATAAWDSMTSGNIISDIPLLKQYFELKSGKSLFTGKDIVPGNLQRLAPEMQYTNNTSSLAKWLGNKIGVSPIKVDYAVGSTFGLWGKDIMSLSSGVDPDAPAQSWEDTVFVRRLLKDPARTSDVTTKFWEYMGHDTGKYNQNVNTYDDLIKKFRDDEAKSFADKLPDAQRAFLIMKSAANEDGKPAFKPDEKRLHPLQRAYDAVTILNGLRRELTENTFKTYEGGTQQKLDPQARRDLIDNVRELAQMEMRNALVILKEPGYANRPVFNVNDTMDKIMALDTTVGNEIATRYATAKIYKTDAVARTFPALQSELLRNGSEADVGNLADEAGADGYQFDGDRVKKPQKRRVQVKTNPAAHTQQ